MRFRSLSLWSVSLLALMLVAPAASAQQIPDIPDEVSTPFNNFWWGLGAVCEPVKDELRGQGITRDNPDTSDSSIEYDPLNNHECRHLRDDVQRAVYEETGADAPSYYGCQNGVPFRPCIGFNVEDCDVWFSSLWWNCIGGIFPDNAPN